MIAGMTFYQIAWFFIMYSFIGWVVEVIFHAVTLGKIINRGFLNGPYCPVYGVGMIALLGVGNIVSQAVPGNAAEATELDAKIVFLFGLVLATLVELIAGWILDKLFHARWWDYSDKPFNLHGYICLEFSLLWGVGAVIVVKVSHPVLAGHTAAAIPEEYGWWILLALYLTFIVDVIVTVLTVQGLNKKLAEIEKMRALLRTPSDFMSETIGTGSMQTAQILQEGQVQAALAKAELTDKTNAAKAELTDKTNAAKAELADKTNAAKAELAGRTNAAKAELADRTNAAVDSLKGKTAAAREEWEKRSAALVEEITKNPHFGTGRLLKAFPNMKHDEYDEIIEALRKKINFPERHIEEEESA